MKAHRSFRLDDLIFEMLRKQAEHERRSMGAQIEYLILKENKEEKC